MRVILWSLNILVLLTLSLFAKDNIIAQFNHWFLSTNTQTVSNIEVVFSPNQGATDAIVKAISEARKSVLVSAYSFTSQKIAQALLDAKKRNVDVKIILDKSQVSQRYSSSKFFENLGFDLKIDVKHAIYHNKVMIIDDKTIITGSFNFTKAAESKNAENILIIRDNPKLAQLYKQDWLKHWNNAVTIDKYSLKK